MAILGSYVRFHECKIFEKMFGDLENCLGSLVWGSIVWGSLVWGSLVWGQLIHLSQRVFVLSNKK